MSTPSSQREIHKTESPNFKSHFNESIHSGEIPAKSNSNNGEGEPLGPTADYILSEMIRQIPSLTEKEALPLSQMIADQLRRWNWPVSQLTFRRTQIIERTSRASVTIIDFECFTMVDHLDVLSSPRQRHYSSTLVMSDITDPDNPELQLGCLWAPAYDGREGATFLKEADHVLSVLRQCSGETTDYRDNFINAVAINAIQPLYEKHFTNMEPEFTSAEAAIQRACAWGVVAAKSREVEYRLFAASLSCFLNFELQKNNFSFRESQFSVSKYGSQNDLCYTLTPVLKITDVEIGT